jgi:nicotinamide-nucleotide adenylyltransferase
MNYALYVGRFQPIHWGHVKVIQSIVADGYNPIIVVGSAQELKSNKNPLDAKLRVELIHDLMKYIAPKNYHVIALDDISTDGCWVEYVLNNVKFMTGHTPKIFYGGDSTAIDLFEKYGMKYKKIDRVALEISGTSVRDCIRKEDPQWKYFVPNVIQEKVYKAFYETSQ